MNSLFASTMFWALPEHTAETILHSLAESLEKLPEGASPAGAKEGSSVKRQDDTLSASAGALVAGSGAPVPSSGVAVIPVDGVLTKKTQYGFWGDRLTTGYNSIRAAIEDALSDSKVRAILLDIDSPGGAVPGCQELADFVAEAAKVKPMAAYTSGIMASAAYWLGSATGCVFCTETAMLGSIGVIMTVVDRTKANEKWGVKVHVISSGAFKAAGHPDLGLTDQDREMFQARVSGTHAVFRRSVRERMGLTAPAEAWGEAQVFLGAPAVEAGLATAVVSGMEEAITKLVQEVSMDVASLKTQHPEVAEAIRKEGYEAAKAEHSFSAEAFLAAAKPFMAESGFAQAKAFFEKAASLGMTMEQMQGMAALMPQQAAAPAPKVDPEAEPKTDPALQAGSVEDRILAKLLEAQKPQAGAAPGENNLSPDAVMLNIAARKAGDK